MERRLYMALGITALLGASYIAWLAVATTSLLVTDSAAGDRYGRITIEYEEGSRDEVESHVAEAPGSSPEARTEDRAAEVSNPVASESHAGGQQIPFVCRRR